MNTIINDKNLVAYCGLYCGACKSFLGKKCNGCHQNDKATWCKIRSCCIKNKYNSCADCSDHKTATDCAIFNNFISKIFSFLFRSDRNACIEQIRTKGIEFHANDMSLKRQQTIKKK